MKMNKFEKWFGIAATAAMLSSPLMSQTTNGIGGDDPKKDAAGNTATEETGTISTPLYEQDNVLKMKSTVLPDIIMLNSTMVELNLSKNFEGGDYQGYQLYNPNQALNNNFNGTLTGNFQVGRNFSVAGGLKNNLTNSTQGDAMLKYTLHGYGHDHVIMLKGDWLNRSSSDITKVAPNSFGAAYMYSAPNFNIVGGADYAHGQGTGSDLMAGGDMILNTRLLRGTGFLPKFLQGEYVVSGMVKANFGAPGVWASQEYTVGVSRINRNSAYGISFDATHQLTQLQNYIWAPDKQIGCFNTSVKAFYMGKIGQEGFWEVSAGWNSLRSPPIGQRPNVFDVGLRGGIDLRDIERTFGGSGQGHSSKKDEQSGLYLPEKNVKALGAAFSKDGDSGLYLPSKKEMNAKERMLADLRSSVRAKNIEHAPGTFSQKAGSNLYTLNRIG